MKRAVELAIDEANASQEVKDAGITFVMQAEDDAGDPKQAVNVANALAGDTEVVGVVGHFNSGCSIPASPVYNRARPGDGLGLVESAAHGAGASTNVNRIVAKDDAQGGFAGDLASSIGLQEGRARRRRDAVRPGPCRRVQEGLRGQGRHDRLPRSASSPRKSTSRRSSPR